jgi:hypothetical protein
MNLSSNVKVTVVSPSAAVGTTTIVGTTLDMAGFDGVLFVLALGAFTDGTPGVKASSGSASNGSDKQDLLGALASVGVANEAAILDLYRPTDRYVTAQVVRGGAAGSVVDSLIAIQYMPGSKPTTQDVNTIASTTLVISPAYGVA